MVRMSLLALVLGAVFCWFVLLPGIAGAEDEGSISSMKAEPSPFSPANSPGKLDKAGIDFELTRELPIWIEISKDDRTVLVVESPDIRRHVGKGNDRYVWLGRDGSGRACEDGVYTLRAMCRAELAWRFGDPTAERNRPGVIREPHAIALAGNGTLYVSGSDGTIQIFDPKGKFVSRIQPTLPKGAARLGWIHAMALLDKNTLLVRDNQRVAKVDTANGAASILVDLSSQKKRMDWLDGMAVDSRGRILLICQGAVQVFSADGKPAGAIGDKGSGDAKLGKPCDIAVGPGDEIYVTDQNGRIARIAVFDKNGKYLRSINTFYNGGELPLAFPRQIAALDDGSLVVSDGSLSYVTNTNKMKAFAHISAEGKLLDSWGEYGSGDGQFQFVSRIATNGREIAVSDHYDNHRVVRMSPSGEVQQTYATPPGVIIDAVAIVPFGPEHYAIFDKGLSRCTVLDRDGELTACWPYWNLTPMNTGSGVIFGGSRTDRKVYMASPLAISVLDEEGKPERTVQIQLPKGQAVPVNGMFVDGDGTMLLACGQFGIATSQSAPLIGKMLVLDSEGNIIQTVDAPVDGGAYFGQVVSYDPKQPDRVAVQYSWREKNSDAAALAILHIRPGEPIRVMDDDGKIHMEKPSPPEGKGKGKSKTGSSEAAKVLGIIATAELVDSNGPVRITYDGPLAAGGGCFYRGVGEIACYDGTGRYLWSLGGMQDKPLRAKALLYDDGRLLVVNDQTGHVECWKIAENPRVLAETTVEIDNTNPIAEVESIEQLVQCKDEPLEIRGTVVDRNLQKYMIYFRAMANKKSGPTRWQEARREDYTQPVTGGALGEIKVSSAFRDRGIEVKVVAWDTAGNSSESLPIEVQFDDDGDGMSNSYEVEKGTKPREATRIREAGDIQIQIDVATLMLPYLSGGHEHQMQLSAWDNVDPAYPVRLDHARLDVSVDAGQFAGGSAGENGANMISTTSSTRLKYTPPHVMQQTITITVNFPEQAINNVIYPAATTAFELDVQQDDDRDWMPDSAEIAPGSDNGADSFRNNPDSDGDGVIDGYDLAPRTNYSGSSDWSSIYEPGMIRYTADFKFFGVGGGDSKVIKYGDVCSGKNIVRSERTYTSDRMKDYLNELLFDRKNEDKSKRKPFEVVGWKGFSVTPPEGEEKLGVFNYGGTGHPEYYFHYYSLSSEGTPIIENVERIDGTKYTDGIHRNYLKVSFPGCDEYVDRTLTIQCKIVGQDLTGEGSWARPMMKLAWLVEFYCESNLRGEHMLFSTFAVTSPVCANTYEAKAFMPGEKFFRNCGVYVKLTPCWMVRTRGQATCTNCNRRVGDEFDNCPYCGCGLNRFSFKPIDKSYLSVSGVQMETASECVQWVQRLQPRANQAMDADIFDQVCVEAINAIDRNSSLHWPLEDDVKTLNVSVGGKSYRVAICSVRGMTRMPKNLKTSEQQAHMKQRAQQLSSQMANMDVVCLIANTERQLQLLANEVNWGADGVWRQVSVSLSDVQGTTAPPESGTSSGSGQENASEETPADTAQSRDICADMAKAKTFVMNLKTWYSCYKDVKKWNESRGYWNLAAGDSKRFGEVLNLQTADPMTGQMLTAQRSIAIQKRFDGGFYISTRTVVKRPYTVWTDPETGITITDKSRSQELILHRTENVVDPDNSKLIERSKQFPGTVPSKWQITMERVTTGLKVGAVVVSNGLRFYQCYEEGDKVGMAVFFTKGVVEGAHIIASAKKVDSVFVSGLAITKTGGSKISIVGVAVGVLETGYNAYKWSQIDNPIDKNQAANDTIASAFNAGIGALEPWGGVILASWTVGAKLGDWIADLWGLEETPANSSVVNSPGEALVFLPLHWLPESVPPGIAKSAGIDAQLEAEKRVAQHNVIWNRKRTYLFVPPN